MKTIQILFVLALMLLSIDTVSAQYGNNGYGNNGYGNNSGGYGGNGRMSQIPQSSSQDKPKEIPVEVTVGKIMEKIKPQLNLDALQEIAISNVLKESIRSQGILLKAETSQDQKTKEIQALSETTDRKINEYLNKDQKIKYKEMSEEGNMKNKSRRNR